MGSGAYGPSGSRAEPWPFLILTLMGLQPGPAPRDPRSTPMAAWTHNDMPDQTGRIVVVTGATSGLGLWCARGLAARGAEVVLAVRNTEKGEATARSLRSQFPMAKLSVRELDLTSLASIWHF